ncbi:NIPSNAP family containing protein [Streptomyces yanii]|uniref:NIPSNAP family containing protein n=1 Tax=Streptomyces yanii TaxID=78510 RepID=UPI0031F0D492
MYYEIRRYQSRPGRREEWVRFMEDVGIPFQDSLGMGVTASFVDTQDEDGYVWMRRFEDEVQSEGLYAGRLPARPLEERDRAGCPRPADPREDRRHPGGPTPASPLR